MTAESVRRVLLIDSASDPSGHAALRRRAFERLDCSVLVLDLKEKQGLLARWRGGTPQDRISRAILEHRPDLILVVEGAELTTATLQQLRRDTEAVWAAWFVGGVRSEPLMEAVSPGYDHVFVPGTDLAGRLRSRSGPREDRRDGGVLYLPSGADPSVHRPVPSRDEFRSNVVFVGGATPAREQLLSELREYGLAVWGPGWRRTTLKDQCRGDALSLDDYVQAYAGGTVGINIHRDDASSGTATGCNQRLFELAAIGVVQVVDQRADLPLHFESGREVVTFRSGSELRSEVQSLLDDPSRLERIAQAGRRRALAEHTYMHRIAVILAETLERGRRSSATTH